ncbi:hypothetical protein [Streptomyces jumonjinensis]|uniref:hypothetical protein n=1 Tax=Streptomyces jumonjinensis TaxID=1945 RepID=UPI00379E394F
MSRETDSSSSGPQGRGGAAYPSGTPPYGSRQYPSSHPAQGAADGPAGGAADGSPEPKADGAKSEPKTETTLTTRIRINIPGSRPIPPVVMRKPMSESEAPAAAPAEPDPERTAAMPVIGGPQGGEPAPAEPPTGEKPGPGQNDWFAPRRGSSGTNGAGIPSPGSNGAGIPSPGSNGAGIPSPGMGPGGAGVPAPGARMPGPFDATAPAARDQGAPQAPAAGLQSMSAGLQSTAAGPLDQAPAAPAAGAYGGAQGPHPRSALSELTGTGGAPASGGGFAPGGGPHPGAVAEPTGATSGPVKGSMPIRQRKGPGAPAAGGPGAAAPAAPGSGTPGTPGAPGIPGAGPGSGPRQSGAPRMSDDTAILTPQKPAPAPAPAPGGHVSGDTLTSGIPVVPQEQRPPFPAPGAPGGPDFPARPGGAKGKGPAASRQTPQAKKKGRSKLVLLGVGVVALFGVAYGAGLLLNHSEVPKRTTVLGVDIGGGTKEQAVVKLEQALGKRAATPLQLTVGDSKEELAPDKAGLVLDSQATVRKAAGSDYNPVSVIGSLFGGERIVQPEIPVDEEKLSVALTDLAGEAGSAVEGTITFEPGRAVAVPGKAGQTLDVERSMLSVKDAFRAQVETGRPNAVQLPVGKSEPAVSNAEIDRAMKEFAEPAMSGVITISAGGRSIPFGPTKSLPQILSMKAIDGKLVEVYDKKAIEELLGGFFDGVLITKGDGKQHQLSADDVAQAMGPALRGTTPEERTAVIELNPS